MTMAFRAPLLAALVVAAIAVLAPAALAGSPRKAPLDPAFARDLKAGRAFVRSPVDVGQGAAAALPRLKAVVLPAAYDLRDVQGVSYLTDMKDQGAYNTC